MTLSLRIGSIASMNLKLSIEARGRKTHHIIDNISTSKIQGSSEMLQGC